MALNTDITIRTLLALGLLSALGLSAPAITIGNGPAIGTDKRGTVWYEQFQDWTASDIRSLDPNNDAYPFNDGHDTARDLVAFYSHDDGTNLYFRADFFELLFGSEGGALDLYVAIDCATGGQEWLPDFTDTRADPAHMWELCISLYNGTAATLYDASFAVITPGNWLGSHWRSDLDAVEFGIPRATLTTAGWDGSSPLHFQVFTTRDGTETGNGEIPGRSDIVDHVGGTLTPDTGDTTGILVGGIFSDATAGRAKYAAIAHANQSLSTQANTQGHLFTDRGDIDLYPGFIRALDSHAMLGAPLNMHLSGTLLSSLQWSRQDPTEPSFPERDGPTFVLALKAFLDSGVGSLIGGVYAEHIMPYYEGAVNVTSMELFNQLADDLFSWTTNDMQVMHVPERVIHSDTNWPHASTNGPLRGTPFQDILDGGYTATYLDEVTHLHWWFYPDEQNNPGWDANNCGRWAGGQGNDEEPYHHKIHRINGVDCFMINDREDQSKFGPYDGGMALDTRFTLLDKAQQPDQAQLTLVFDDWEAFAGNSFASSTPNNNADQWHATIRWAANHPWIEIVNLRDILAEAQTNPDWVIDQGTVTDKTMQTYEWLKRASEQSYDHWYYGHGLESNFFARVPGTAPDGSAVSGTKAYGDLNTPNSLMRDAWAAVEAMPAGRLRTLAEYLYVAMIYETAWHDEDANPDQYKSRNYQVDFNRGVAQGNCDTSVADTTYDNTAGWALKLQGHVRKVGILADAAAWAAAVTAGTQGAVTVALAADVDDDLQDEYILKNDRAYLCIERWGARVVAAFRYDPALQDAVQVIGAFTANPAEEHDGEGSDNLRCSAFKDRFATGPNNSQYVDMDYAATPPVADGESWSFISADGQIRKRLFLPAGRDLAGAEYTLDPSVGTLYPRMGLGPNQLDLLTAGDANLVMDTNETYRGLRNLSGGAAYAVAGRQAAVEGGAYPGAGWNNRDLPLVEQAELRTLGTNATIYLAFSLASAADLDADGLTNEDELNLHGTDPELWDSEGDGIPDGYEIDHGLNAALDDADDDLDEDGASNRDEFLAGTEADEADSLFEIVSLGAGGGPVQITCSTVPGRSYSIYYADAVGAWVPFANGTQVETNVTPSSITFDDDFTAATSGAVPTGPLRAYRIDVAVPQGGM